MAGETTTQTTTPEVATSTTTQAVQTTTSVPWRDGLPDELKGEKSLANIADVPTLAKGYVEAQRLIGSSIRLPKADAKPEERAAFTRDTLTKLGLPESPDKYEITAPQGVTLDQDVVTSFRGVAHEVGLLPKQVQRLTAWQVGLAQAAQAKRAEAQAAAEKALREEWGGAYDHKLALIQRVAKDIGGDEFIAEMGLTGKGNSPAVLRFMDAVAEALQGTELVRGTPAGGGITREQAEATLKEAAADPGHEFWKKRPEDQRTYYVLAYGTKAIPT